MQALHQSDEAQVPRCGNIYIYIYIYIYIQYIYIYIYSINITNPIPKKLGHCTNCE